MQRRAQPRAGVQTSRSARGSAAKAECVECRRGVCLFENIYQGIGRDPSQFILPSPCPYASKDCIPRQSAIRLQLHRRANTLPSTQSPTVHTTRGWARTSSIDYQEDVDVDDTSHHATYGDFRFRGSSGTAVDCVNAGNDGPGVRLPASNPINLVAAAGTPLHA